MFDVLFRPMLRVCKHRVLRQLSGIYALREMLARTPCRTKNPLADWRLQGGVLKCNYGAFHSIRVSLRRLSAGLAARGGDDCVSLRGGDDGDGRRLRDGDVLRHLRGGDGVRDALPSPRASLRAHGGRGGTYQSSRRFQEVSP